MKTVFLLLSLICTISLYAADRVETPKNGYVPDEATAVRIAEAVFTPIYGEKHVRSERPFHARLDGDHWVVSGTMPKAQKPGLIVFGGTMVAEIDRNTACIRSVYHLK